MLIPQLKEERLLKLLEDQKEFKESVESVIGEFNPQMSYCLLMGLLANGEAVRGFLICYIMIREALMAKEISELDKLTK